jgi:hypothetical protein
MLAMGSMLIVKFAQIKRPGILLALLLLTNALAAAPLTITTEALSNAIVGTASPPTLITR